MMKMHMVVYYVRSITYLRIQSRMMKNDECIMGMFEFCINFHFNCTGKQSITSRFYLCAGGEGYPFS